MIAAAIPEGAMPRTAAILLLSLLAGLLPIAPAASANAGKLDAIQTRGKLLVGVTESSPPFSYRDGAKGIVGYDVDLAGQVAKRLGVAMAKVVIINADRTSALKQDRVDLVAVGMTRAKNRAGDVDFSYAYLNSPHMILVRTASGIKHISDLASRKLALVRSASVDSKLKAAVPTMQIVYFDTYDAAFAALQNGSIDAFLADKMLVLWFAQKSGHAADFALIADYQLPRTSGFALKKDEPRFRDFVDRTLLDLEASGAATKIYDAWFAPLPRDFRIAPD
jgi:polar amino acid transport system substrate-binding protein